MNSGSDIKSTIQAQRDHFYSGITRPVEFRLKQLKHLQEVLIRREDEIFQALKKDFGKPAFETYLSENGFVLSEISYIISRLKSWMKIRRLPSNLVNFPSRSYLFYEPQGCVLVISPWNYPFQLALNPAVGALAAGNCCMIKPSELAPATSSVLAGVINDEFDRGYLHVVEGGIGASKILLNEKFDHIFFTGSEKVGKIIAGAAARHLTPVTLELGGKSPCIVDESADLDKAVRRIVWGKYFNAGQTCVAPDYVYAHAGICRELLTRVARQIEKFYGPDPEESPDYPRIINRDHFDRLCKLIDKEKVYYGGQVNADNLYIAPTVMKDVGWDDAVMKEEIFGPVLPILSFEKIEEVILQLGLRPKPLAFYLFTREKPIRKNKVLELSFGSGSINDTIAQFGNPNIPFGGVGSSGYGAYHGRYSFETFSHKKGILAKANWLDIPLRYAPYRNNLKWLKKAFRINFEW